MSLEGGAVEVTDWLVTHKAVRAQPPEVIFKSAVTRTRVKKTQ